MPTRTDDGHSCTSCDGRPRVVTSPEPQGYYSNGNVKPATSGARGSFEQACVVCSGTGRLYTPLPRFYPRDEVDAPHRPQ